MSMRISTSQVYDTGIKGMQRAQSAVYKTQNQISADTRILRPSDDPVSAAQAVTVSQAKAINEQYQTNQSNAANQLAQADTQLSSVTTALQNVRDLLVRAGNTGTMTNEDRQSIATELESKMSELLGIANSTDELGNYAFSGYQGDTLPFARDASGSVAYSGDAGQRLLQVSASRQIATNVSGYDVFMDSKTGNGTFVATTTQLFRADASNKGTVSATSTEIVDQSAWAAAARPLELSFVDATNYEVRDSSGTLVDSGAYSSPTAINLSAGVDLTLYGTPVAGDSFSIDALNTGSATIDAGSVLNPQKWKLAANDASNPLPLAISFAANGSGVMEYTITDNAGNTTTQAFTAGQAISLSTWDEATSTGFDFGSQVVISGTPAEGDSFIIDASATQSMFDTIQGAITALKTGVNTTTYTSTQLVNDLAAQISNIDLAMENVNKVQSIVGASAKEVDELGSTSADLAIQYASDLSDLVDLDYYETYSNYLKQQATLQAAQQSFTKIAGKSLFDYM